MTKPWWFWFSAGFACGCITAAVLWLCDRAGLFLPLLALLLALPGCQDSRAPLMRGQVQDDARQDEQIQPPGDELPPPKAARAPAWADEVIEAAKDEARARGHGWIATKIVMCAGPEGLARVTGMPKVERGGLVVARSDKRTGTIWLSRESRADLAHECAHLFMDYGRSEADEDRCEAFARCVEARLAAMERALCGMLNGNDKR